MRSKIRNIIYEPIAFRTRSRIIKLKNKQSKLGWVSATNTHNYMLKDGICDWLKVYGKTENIVYNKKIKNYEKTFSSFLMDKGNDFEKKIIKYLKSKFRCIKVADFYTLSDANKTIKFMKKGIPIIYSAPVYNNNNKTYGIVDLLVRSDYINQIFNENIISTHQETFQAPNLCGKYHYRVIDIKYSTLNLSSDGKHLTNSNRIPAYKSQLYIYNEAISSIQGYNPKCAYLMGRRWKYTSKGVNYQGNRCDDRLGIVDFNDYDYDFVEKSNDAIDWYRNVMGDGINWTVYPPTNKELYPNMCIDSHNFNNMKNKIAHNIGEITMLWNCGVKHRNNAIENGVDSWKDKNCNSKILGFGENSNYGKLVDKIININRDSKELILPKKIKKGNNEWLKEKVNEMFVDFETFNDVCMDIDNIPYQKKYNVIYMIGVGIKKNNNWHYKSFITKNTSKDEELRIIKQFYNYYNELNKPIVYYWHAEKPFWNKSCQSHNLNLNINWYDMCKEFKNNQITIKGCFGFGLKEIAKQMKSYHMIDTELESECNNGMVAMIKAWKCYNNIKNPIKSPIMKDIEKYNEFDCKAIYDITNYLRNKYN